jgi:hypothetical protein
MTLFALAAQADDEGRRMEVRSEYAALLAKYTERLKSKAQSDLDHARVEGASEEKVAKRDAPRHK